MASSLFQLVLLFVAFFFSNLHSASANLHKTRSLLKHAHFSPLLSSQTLNATSPTLYYDVTKPISGLPTTQPPCSHRVLRHDFGSSFGRPPVTADYTLPSHCPFRDFSKIVLEFKATCRGRQFDRIFGVWLDGVELLRSCTAEPRPTGIFWSVKKDVTKYHSLLVKNETQTLAVYIGNIVDKTYTGVYHVDIIFHYYPVDEGQGRNIRTSASGYGSYADLILPISRNPPLNDGLWLEIVNSTDPAYKEFKIPRNVYRAVLEVYVSFHENDEFWYGNLPNDYITANNLSAAGNGPFREVVITLDGEVVGAVWPFTVVYTGGINPLLWRPITAIGSFDLPTYDIEITPFLGSLLDGKPHKLGFSVTNALNVWYIDANLHLWLDSKNEKVEAKTLEFSSSSLDIVSTSEFEGLNGKFKMKANRSITSIGWVKSSHGKIITNVVQEFSYGNTMAVRKDGNLQILDQLIQVDDRIYTKKGSNIVHSLKSFKSFPFYLYSDYSDKGHGISLSTANLTMGFNEKRSENISGLRSFNSDLKNKQDGQGVMVVKDSLVIRGLGGTQQVYKYIGSDQCYFRNISSSNYTILFDKVETFCWKTPKSRFRFLSRLPSPV